MPKNDLLSFRIDGHTRDAFEAYAQSNNTTMTALLKGFINQCLGGTLEANGVDDGVKNHLKRLESKIEAIESKIGKINNNDETHQEQKTEGLQDNLKGVEIDPNVAKILDKIFKGAGEIPTTQWEKLAPKQPTQREKLAPYVKFVGNYGESSRVMRLTK